jgi:hypothetical protein
MQKMATNLADRDVGLLARAPELGQQLGNRGLSYVRRDNNTASSAEQREKNKAHMWKYSWEKVRVREREKKGKAKIIIWGWSNIHIEEVQRQLCLAADGCSSLGKLRDVCQNLHSQYIPHTNTIVHKKSNSWKLYSITRKNSTDVQTNLLEDGVDDLGQLGLECRTGPVQQIVGVDCSVRSGDAVAHVGASRVGINI